MGELLTITVEHNGKEQQLDAQLLVTGYTHKFLVVVNDTEVVFERDEEGGYRAVVPNADEKMMRKLNLTLLQKIADTLQSNLA